MKLISLENSNQIKVAYFGTVAGKHEDPENLDLAELVVTKQENKVPLFINIRRIVKVT